MKLKYSEVSEFRKVLLTKQNGNCALCGQHIEEGTAVLDHDHKTGYCRAVLHRDCNILLGKLENFIRTRGKSMLTPVDKLPAFLNSVFDFLKADYSKNPHHPTHKFDHDKRLKILKGRLKKVKSPSAIKRIKDEISKIKSESR